MAASRPDEPLDTITSIGGTDLISFYTQTHVVNTQARLMSEFLYSDPILYLLCVYHRYMERKRVYVRHIDTDMNILNIGYSNSHGEARHRFRELMRARYDGYLNNARSSWKQRRSLSLYGTTTLRKSKFPLLSALGFTFFSQPSDLRHYPVALMSALISGVETPVCTFDSLRLFALVVQGFIGREFLRTTSLSRYGSMTLEALSVSSREITYTMSNVVWQSYPIGRTMKAPSITVSIRRGKSDNADDVSVSITGLNTIRIDGVVISGAPNWRSATKTLSPVSSGSDYEADLVKGGYYFAEQQRYLSNKMSGPMAGLIGAIDEPIRVFAPGLYHTQSKAISSLMVDYSSNFENLVQSPELLGLLAPLYASVEEPWFKKITSGAPSKYWLYWSHVVRLARFLNGAILLYNFALAPNIRAIRKLAEPMFTPRAGEGTFTIEGLRTFSTEDPSLQHAVLQGIPELTGLTSADIIYHKIVFRSTAYTALTWTMLAKAIAAHNPLVRIHGYPSAEQIFATAQYSFVVDWALNLSSLINDHEVYANSPSLPLRIGHTVHVELAASDGRWFENFFRSTEAKYPMDPPGITWLPTTNLPAIAIPFGIQQLFR